MNATILPASLKLCWVAQEASKCICWVVFLVFVTFWSQMPYSWGIGKKLTYLDVKYSFLYTQWRYMKCETTLFYQRNMFTFLNASSSRFLDAHDILQGSFQCSQRSPRFFCMFQSTNHIWALIYMCGSHHVCTSVTSITWQMGSEQMACYKLCMDVK